MRLKRARRAVGENLTDPRDRPKFYHLGDLAYFNGEKRKFELLLGTFFGRGWTRSRLGGWRLRRQVQQPPSRCRPGLWGRDAFPGFRLRLFRL